jgi:hypothetical protein
MQYVPGSVMVEVETVFVGAKPEGHRWLLHRSAFRRTYPDLTRFPDGRFYVHLPKDRSESVNECIALKSTVEVRPLIMRDSA